MRELTGKPESWTPADFVDRAKEIRDRLLAWHDDGGIPQLGYGGSGPYTLTEAMELAGQHFRDCLPTNPSEHHPRPRVFEVRYRGGPFVAIDKPGATLPKLTDSEMAVRLMPESLTSKPLAEWCLCDFNEHLRTDAGTSEGWKLVGLAFDRVLGLNRFDCDVVRTTNEQLAVQASGNAKSVCHFIRCRRIEPRILDNFVDAAEGLLTLSSPAADDATTPDAFGFVATKTHHEQPGKRMTIDQRMKLLLFENPESSGWTISEFEAKLQCSRGGIHKTASWKALEAARQLGKAERRKDRRAKTRPSQVNKPRGE